MAFGSHIEKRPLSGIQVIGESDPSIHFTSTNRETLKNWAIFPHIMAMKTSLLGIKWDLAAILKSALYQEYSQLVNLTALYI